MEFKVVKINHEFKTLLYLTKRLLKRILKKKEIIGQLQKDKY
jgi:hypothetical protein